MALEQALELAAQGIPCFPCNAKKEPLCRQGFKRATKDAAELHLLWQGAWQPAVRIGVPTGEASGFFVLDIDSARHESAVQWHERFAELLPETRRHKTESGGWHYLFQHHAGLGCTGSKLERGIDTKGQGGYIVWWPAHVVSAEHRFLPVAPVPGWLVEALNSKPARTPSYYAAPQCPSGYASARLEGILATVAQAREGERNAITFWGACRIADMIAERELDQSEANNALAALYEAASRTGLTMPEIRRTIANAGRA
jgi:hypothetical protein